MKSKPFTKTLFDSRKPLCIATCLTSVSAVLFSLNSKLVNPKSYSLAARETLSSNDYAGLEKYEISKHSVMMELQLAHELRLINFIDRLVTTNLGGITTVENCEMTVGKSGEKEFELTKTQTFPNNDRLEIFN